MTIQSPPARHKRTLRNQIIVLAAFLLLLYVVVPQFGAFTDSLDAFSGIAWTPVALAMLAIIAAYMMSAATYTLLAVSPIRYGRTLLVQGASAFANRILPAGLGGLTLNVQYLRKHGHTTAQAVVVAGTNNFLGFVGHAAILIVMLILQPTAISTDIRMPEPAPWMYVIGVCIAGGLFLSFSYARVRRRMVAVGTGLVLQFTEYRKRPLRLAAAFTCSLMLTGLYVATFYLCGLALGHPLEPIEAIIAFSVGMLVGTLLPTPGGVGGAEAGLVAGGVAYGLDPSIALAVALLYRFLTYWLPLLPGFGLFMRARTYLS